MASVAHWRARGTIEWSPQVASRLLVIGRAGSERITVCCGAFTAYLQTMVEEGMMTRTGKNVVPCQNLNLTGGFMLHETGKRISFSKGHVSDARAGLKQ